MPKHLIDAAVLLAGHHRHHPGPTRLQGQLSSIGIHMGAQAAGYMVMSVFLLLLIAIVFMVRKAGRRSPRTA